MAATDGRAGPHFYSGSTITIAGTVDGDVYATGQNITISGHVTGDVIAAAQDITLTGTVDGDVRLAGQNVTIGGAVSRSGTIAAADLSITSQGSFGNDVVGAAQTADVAGRIGRDLRLSVGQLTVAGTVGGSITYVSDQAARLATGSVSGPVDHILPSSSSNTPVAPGAAFLGWLLGLLYALVALSLVTLVAGLLVPRWLHRVAAETRPTPWRALLVGLVAAVAVPTVIVIFLLTIVGAPLALVVLLVWLLLSLATFPVASYYVGVLVLRDRRRPVVTILVGGAIVIVALHVPWLNVLVAIAMLLFGVGAQLLAISRRRPWRPWSDGPPRGAADRSDLGINDPENERLSRLP